MPAFQTLDPWRFEPSDWDDYPEQAFENWLVTLDGRIGSPFKESSADIYKVQWRSFIRYTQDSGLRLIDVTADVVSSFLASLHEENRNQRERFGMLLERVFSVMHDGNSSPNYVNPAALARGEQGAAWKKVRGNLPTSFVTSREREILIKYFESDTKGMSPTYRWRELRNRALVAMFLGAGLKVSEATALTVDCMARTDPDGCLEITVLGSRYPRLVLPAPFTVRLLEDWNAERTAKSKATRISRDQPELLFPAQKCGGRMTSITPVRITAAIICASGLSDAREERLSPQIMRNSFIAECFESGHTAREVTSALGFATILTAERWKQEWEQWKSRQRIEAENANAQPPQSERARAP